MAPWDVGNVVEGHARDDLVLNVDTSTPRRMGMARDGEGVHVEWVGLMRYIE